MDINSIQRSLLENQDLTFLQSVPYVYHCHHYNLFHDQTIDDALGEEVGAAIRTRAAHDAMHHLLSSVIEQHHLATPTERLQLALSLIPAMGHGKLEIAADAKGGSARGEHLHYGHSWKEKYGSQVKRLHPADAVAAGFAAAVVEAVYDLEPGAIDATEKTCIALRNSFCSFELTPSTNGAESNAPVGLEACAAHASASFGGLDEERIAEIGKGLQEFVRGVAGDERGLVQAFGVYVTMHLSSYYNQTIYETVHQVEKTQPANLPLAEALLREAGHVCVFNTFGNILLSPEWEGMVGPLSGDIADTVAYCCAVARGLGFGHWAIGELVPGERFVMRAPVNYEVPFYLQRYGQANRPRCYIFQGAALAIMLLAHAVDWKSRPDLTPEFYLSLFQSGRLPWKVEETRCKARGDQMCEAVVTKA